MSMKRVLADGTNNALRPLGVQIVRGYSGNESVRSFVSARKTIAAARRGGISVADYIDANNAEPGTTAASVEAMLKLADLNEPVSRVCEIGPGTGRYAEKVIAALRPNVYEMYETARDWLPHLRMLPGAKMQAADGRTLASTASASVDLVHAHKVFVYIPLVTTVGYVEEMARVVRPGGAVAFDIITEDCLDEAVTNAWVAENITIYSMISRKWTIDLLDRRGLTLLGSSFAPLSGGRTELLVFRKRA
jgi:SAM-dependent methyltransferase